jgi:hypothetical protein
MPIRAKEGAGLAPDLVLARRLQPFRHEEADHGAPRHLSNSQSQYTIEYSFGILVRIQRTSALLYLA